MDNEIIIEKEPESVDFCLGCGDEFFLSELVEGLCKRCQRQEKRERNSQFISKNKKSYRYE